MAESGRVRFRAAPHAIAALLLPLMLLHPRAVGVAVPSLILGAGIPGLVILSLLLLIFALPPTARKIRMEKHPTHSLPDMHPLSEALVLEADPPRPLFLPGVRTLFRWHFVFGPFSRELLIPLPGRGKGRGKIIFSRRGAWLGRASLRISDTLGFFSFDLAMGPSIEISVPPGRGFSERHISLGHPSAAASTALRHREDADERLERRKYISGDDPRRLDWKHYARTGDLLVRVGEEGIPARNRIWLQVLPPVGLGLKNRYRLLDAALSEANKLVWQLFEEGQEIRVRLPGEASWALPVGDEWPRRLARTHPRHPMPDTTPKPGEQVVVLSPSPDAENQAFVRAALDSGCQVQLVKPDLTAPGASWTDWLVQSGDGDEGLPWYRIFHRYRGRRSYEGR